MDSKKLDKIKQLISQGKNEDKYLNLDTMRLVQKSNVQTRKPIYINEKLRIFSDTNDLYHQVLQALQPNTKVRYISSPAPDSKSTGAKDAKSTNTTSDTDPSSSKKGKRTSLRPNIPKNIRTEIWEKQHGKECYTGYCYCCLEKLLIDNYEAGHIKPYFHGGSDTVDNLKPICKSCNISMTTLHMYEYMIRFNKAGKKNIPITRSYIFFNGLVQSCNESVTKLDKMIQSGQLSVTKAEKIRNSLLSSRAEVDKRLEVIEEIRLMECK